MKLVAHYSPEVQQAINKLEAMISDRKDTLYDKVDDDKMLSYLYSSPNKVVGYISEDLMIKQLREELVRIYQIAIPQNYTWEKE